MVADAVGPPTEEQVCDALRRMSLITVREVQEAVERAAAADMARTLDGFFVPQESQKRAPASQDIKTASWCPAPMEVGP